LPVDSSRIMLRRSAGYFAISTISSLGLFLLLACAVRDVARSAGLAFESGILPFAILGFLLSVEDYLVAVFAPRSRNEFSGKLRELFVLALFLYAYAMSVQFLGSWKLTPVPGGVAIFMLIWGSGYWFSHSLVFDRYTSRFDIARLLESRRGQELTRVLQDERLFVLGSFTMMQTSIRGASFRLFLTSVILIAYSAEIYPLPTGIQIVAIFSILGQVLMGAVSRMYAEDHHYLAWGAIPADDQRRRRSSLMTALIAAAGLLAIPFFGNRSLISPQPIFLALAGLFDRMNAPRAMNRLNRLRFLNPPGNTGTGTLGDYASQAPNQAAQWYFDFMDNLFRVGLVALGIYLLIIPLIRDPRIIRALMRAIRSNTLKSALAELASLFRLWGAGFFRSLWQMVSFPFRGIVSLLKALKGGGRKKSRVQSESEQKEIIQAVVSRSIRASVQSPEKKREIRTLEQIFTSIVLQAGTHGLQVRKSETIREIAANCSLLYQEMYRNSESERISLSEFSEEKIRSDISEVALLFEESLFSGESVEEERISHARFTAEALTGLFSN
jgi:hypothetical protein